MSNGSLSMGPEGKLDHRGGDGFLPNFSIVELLFFP